MERINNFNNNFIKSNRNSKSANKNNNNKYGNDRYQNITIIKKNNLKSSLNKDQKINQDSIKDLPKKDILKALLFFKIIYNSFLKIKSSIFFSIMKYNFNKKEEEFKNKFILSQKELTKIKEEKKINEEKLKKEQKISERKLNEKINDLEHKLNEYEKIKEKNIEITKKEKEFKIKEKELLIKEKEQNQKEKEYLKMIENYQSKLEQINNENQKNIINEINLLLSKINYNNETYKNKIIEINNEIKENLVYENKYCDKDFIDLKPLSKGGYGIIYTAYNIKDKIEVCLKKINVDEMKLNYELNEFKENSYLKDLNNEIEILKLLSWNKNSLKYYGSYDFSHEKILILEKCDENMEQFMKKRDRALTIKEIKNIFSDFNEILYILQTKKIIHRDLKLTNLLIKYINKEKNDYIVKLADFGISKFSNELNSDFSGYKGTLDSAAPEIILQKVKQYDSIIDIFSLGIILYQLSHNLKHPFKKYTYDNIIRIYNDYYNKDNYQIEFGSSVKNNLDFKDLIIKMLKLNPKNRLTWEEYFEHNFFK